MKKRETLLDRSQRLLGRSLVKDDDSTKSKPAATGRRSQVLHAQRTHRQRTQQYIGELEKEVVRFHGIERDMNMQIKQLESCLAVYREMLISNNLELQPIDPWFSDAGTPHSWLHGNGGPNDGNGIEQRHSTTPPGVLKAPAYSPAASERAIPPAHSVPSPYFVPYNLGPGEFETNLAAAANSGAREGCVPCPNVFDDPDTGAVHQAGHFANMTARPTMDYVTGRKTSDPGPASQAFPYLEGNMVRKSIPNLEQGHEAGHFSEETQHHVREHQPHSHQEQQVQQQQKSQQEQISQLCEMGNVGTSTLDNMTSQIQGRVHGASWGPPQGQGQPRSPTDQFSNDVEQLHLQSPPVDMKMLGNTLSNHMWTRWMEIAQSRGISPLEVVEIREELSSLVDCHS